nr:CPCC family cysteine-rich protein [Virgibacillus dokdonensis]
MYFWEDDYTQFDDPDYEGGANAPSLKQAQRNFILVGACEEEFVEHVRKPNEKDLKVPRWKRIV